MTIGTLGTIGRGLAGAATGAAGLAGMTPGPAGRGIQKLRKGGIEMRLGSLRNGGGTRVVAQAADGWVDVGRAASLAEHFIIKYYLLYQMGVI
ncbi:MAG: hypothetical protein P8Y53_17010 [Pseudolabrys sp.]